MQLVMQNVCICHFSLPSGPHKESFSSLQGKAHASLPCHDGAPNSPLCFLSTFNKLAPHGTPSPPGPASYFTQSPFSGTSLTQASQPLLQIPPSQCSGTFSRPNSLLRTVEHQPSLVNVSSCPFAWHYPHTSSTCSLPLLWAPSQAHFLPPIL